MFRRPLTPEGREQLIREVQLLDAEGYALLPIRPDGTKAPCCPWAGIAAGTEGPLGIDEIARFIRTGQCDGIGLIMGRPSSNADTIELEGRAMGRFEELVEHAVAIGVDELLERLFNGFTDRSPSGGLHCHYRIANSAVGPNQHLARRPNPEDPAKPLVLAETRGQGGQMVCAPSGGRTHQTGLPYERVAGGPATTPVFTRQEVDELYRLFRYLDEMPVEIGGEAAGAGTGGASQRDLLHGDRLLPGDDFNNKVTWEEILVGWKLVTTSIGPDGETRTHWRRPGKALGVSATTFGEDGPLYVFSTSTVLPVNTGLTKFAAYCYLNHGGDFKAAAADLKSRGYGSDQRSTGSGLFEYRPFPVEILPSPLREFVAEAAKASNCDPVYIALPALTALGAAIGTSRRIALKKQWCVPPIIWTGLIGESGNHKSVGRRLALAPVAAIENKAYRRFMAETHEYEQLLAEWDREEKATRKNKPGSPSPTKPTAPVAQRFLVDNVTVEAVAPLLQDNPRGLLLAADELGGWLGSFDRYTKGGKGKGDEAAWLSMYNAEAMRIDRKTGPVKSIYVPRAAVWITGGIPPGSLKRILGFEHRESGLAARFLWAFPPRKVKVWTEDEVRPEVESAYAELFEKLYSLQPITSDDGELIPADVMLTAAAKARIEHIYNKNAKELAELKGDLAAAYSKLEETVGRLALVIHFVRWAGGDNDVNIAFVDENSVEIAAQLVEWFKYEAKRVYVTLLNGKQGGPQTDGQDRLLEFVRNRNGRVGPRDVQQGCRWLRGPGEAKQALQKLVEAGLGCWEASYGDEAADRAARFVLRELDSGEEQGGVPGEQAGVAIMSALSGAPVDV